MAKKKAIEFERDALLIPVGDVMGAIERKATLPVLTGVLLKSNGQELRAIGSNLEMEFQAAREWKGPEFVVLVNAARLHQVLDALPSRIHIELPRTPTGVLTILCGNGRWTVPGFDPATFPEFELKPVVRRLFVPANVLRKALGHAKYAMARDDVRYYLNGMQWLADEHTLTCTASDGHRLAQAVVDIEWDTDELGQFEKVGVILPRYFIPELIAALPNTDEQVVVKFREGSVTIDLPEGLTLSCKLIEGRFPDSDRLWPSAFTAWCDVDREQLESLAKRATVPGQDALAFTLGDSIRLASEGPEGQVAEDEIPVAVREGEAEMGLNRKYLLDALGAVGGKSVQLKVAGAGNQMVIRNPELAGVRSLIMGLRI